MKNPEMLSMEEAAEFLGISRKHLSNILLGKVKNVPMIDHVRAGRRTIIRRTALGEWVAACERQNRRTIEAA